MGTECLWLPPAPAQTAFLFLQTAAFGPTRFPRLVKWAVAYGNGQFVAFAGDQIETSPDGTNWAAIGTTPVDIGVWVLIYGNGRFLVFGNNADAMITALTDWVSLVFTGTTKTLYSAAYGEGTFVAAGDNGTIVYSHDG